MDFRMHDGFLDPTEKMRRTDDLAVAVQEHSRPVTSYVTGRAASLIAWLVVAIPAA
jgi:hypothetical protein